MSHLSWPENFTEIPEVVQKLWRISLSILAIFIDFHQFYGLPCYKEANGVSLYQIMSAFFHFQHALNRFFNNFIKLYWYWISFSWNLKGVSLALLPEKTILKKPSLIRVNTSQKLLKNRQREKEKNIGRCFPPVCLIYFLNDSRFFYCFFHMINSITYKR